MTKDHIHRMPYRSRRERIVRAENQSIPRRRRRQRRIRELEVGTEGWICEPWGRTGLDQHSACLELEILSYDDTFEQCTRPSVATDPIGSCRTFIAFDRCH
jgi:hypothetical protein